MIVASFSDAGITVPRRSAKSDQVKTICPQCSHKRVKSDEPCLNISFDRTDDKTGKKVHLWNCHHCKFRGAVFPDGAPSGGDDFVEFSRRSYKKPTINLDDYELTDEVIEWFAKRGISEQTLIKCGIVAGETKFGRDGDFEDAILFPFYKNGELVNIQYRSLNGKKFKSLSGCELIYYGFDDVVMNNYVATDTLVVVEGPIDKVALRECGYPFVWSVPNGSPFEPEGEPPVKNPNLNFHNDPDAQFVLSRVKKIVYFGDNDHQGRRLVQELATRSGIEKCYRVIHPPECKDADDVLRKLGKEKVIECIENAQRFPIDGVVTIDQIIPELITLYEHGQDGGLSTGFPNLDEIFRVGQGRLIVTTGVPESGKSRYLANLIINLAKLHGVKVSMFTPESRPFVQYLSKMIQILTGVPFGKPGDEGRLSQKKVLEAANWIKEYVTFNSPPERTLESLTTIWKQQMMADGTRYGVLDPFNYIIRPQNVDEGSFVLSSLTYLADWCVKNGFTIFVVVHPTKIHPTVKSKVNSEKKEYPIVTPYNIYGSSHWFNCADFILSIWRSINFHLPVQLHVLKAKQEELGTSNKMALFDYDVSTGIYVPWTGDDVNELISGELERGDDEETPFHKEASVSKTRRGRAYEGDEGDSKPKTRRRSR